MSCKTESNGFRRWDAFIATQHQIRNRKWQCKGFGRTMRLHANYVLEKFFDQTNFSLTMRSVRWCVGWPTLPSIPPIFDRIAHDIDCVVAVDAAQSVFESPNRLWLSSVRCFSRFSCSLVQIVPHAAPSSHPTKRVFILLFFVVVVAVFFLLLRQHNAFDWWSYNFVRSLSLAVQSFVNFRIDRYLVSSHHRTCVSARAFAVSFFAKSSACENIFVIKPASIDQPNK